jgi:hypothetical protein
MVNQSASSKSSGETDKVTRQLKSLQLAPTKESKPGAALPNDIPNRDHTGPRTLTNAQKQGKAKDAASESVPNFEPIAVDDHCKIAGNTDVDASLEKTAPHVVEYDRSKAASNFSLMDVYDTFSDVLGKYGLVHFPGLVQHALGRDALDQYAHSNQTLRESFQWTAWDNVVLQKPGEGVAPTLQIHENVSFKMFRKNSRKETGPYGDVWSSPELITVETFRAGPASKRERGLPLACLENPIGSYWDTIDLSFSRLQSGLTAQFDLDVSALLARRCNGDGLIPENYTAWYGMQMEKSFDVTLQHSSSDMIVQKYMYPADRLYPAHWCQHSPSFGGKRNLLIAPSLQKSGNILLGMASPYSYYYAGTAFTSFPHHYEDFFMPSVNFMYSGAEKYWIGCPAKDTRQVWTTLKEVAKAAGKRADEKKFLLSPQILQSIGGLAEIVEVHQKPGDVVISASGATHGGFNLGSNFAEAVNFCDDSGHDGWLGMWDDMTDFYLEERQRSMPMALMDAMEERSAFDHF